MARALELPLVHHPQARLLHVTPSDDGHWMVTALTDEGQIVHWRCSNWQRVERLRKILERNTRPLLTGMHIRGLLAASLACAALLLAPSAMAQPIVDVNVLFQARLADYVELREQVRHGVIPEHVIDTRSGEISGPLLAVRLQKARAEAEVGDIIPFELANVIRDRLHRAFDPVEVDTLMSGLYADGLPHIAAVVNGHYSAEVAVVPPSTVLGFLPPLPGELGYRLIGRELAVWDEEAQLVVDLVLEALPAPCIWDFLDVSSADLRAEVRGALNDANIDVRVLVEAMAMDDEPGATRPVVGSVFDWRAGNIMPPSVLYALPPLPQALEYRFVGSDLVVIDVRTSVVRGVLWNVLPMRITTRDRT
jgi:hypothetical protein